MEVRALADDERSEGDAILQSVYVGAGYVDASFAGELTVRAHSDAGTWLGAFDTSDSLVGLVLLTKFGSSSAVVAEPGGAEVRLLAVTVGGRGTGAGRALMIESERVARLQGSITMTFSTQTTMTAAQGLYRSLGYARVNERDYSVGDRAFVVFHKQLAEPAG